MPTSILLTLALAACQPQEPAAADPALAPWRIELLDLAMDAASAFPSNPHAKNRSRAQSTVVEACLQLDQPLRACGFAERIQDWRRGAAYAQIALHFARAGRADEAQALLAVAQDVADAPRGEDGQAWQRDSVLVTIAEAHWALGEAEEAARRTAGVVDSELGRVERARAAEMNAEKFDAQMDGLQEVLNAANFDQARGLLEGCAALYDRFHGDVERRARAEDAVKHGWVKLPLQVRIELIQRLAEADLRHGDPARALALVDEAQALFESARWLLEDQIRVHAGLIALRHRAGDPARARREAEGLLAVYNERRAEIVNIERAGALRALAAAHAAMGQGTIALECLRRAAEEGMENPNARPRANDLVATCLALATLDLEPDARFAARLREIRSALRDPW